MSKPAQLHADRQPLAAVAKRSQVVTRLEITAKPGESENDANARSLLDPCAHAAVQTVWFQQSFGPTDLTATHHAITTLVERVHSGDMRDVETTLVAQAAALNHLFTELSRRAALNMGEYLGAAETYMRLALRAQNQSRMTLETLSAIKNPPVVFAKQANIAHGHQQVNNGEASLAVRAPETSNRQTELLEPSHAKPEWLDAGASRATTPGHPTMATVEAIKRPKDA